MICPASEHLWRTARPDDDRFLACYMCGETCESWAFKRIAALTIQLAEAQAACAELQIGLCRAVDYIQTRAPEPNVLALVLPIVERALASSPGRPLLDELARLRESSASWERHAQALGKNLNLHADELTRLRDKSIRFDLDQAAGITQREKEAVELVDLRAEVARLRALTDSQADALRLAEQEIESHPAMIAARRRDG